MQLRTSLTAAGAAAVLGITGALVLPAVASAHSSTHTLKFTSVQQGKGVPFSKTTEGIQDTDVNAANKTVGFDELYVTFTSSGGAANVTVDTNGGMLYGTFNISTKGKITNGKVTGGTGAFVGATGTIKVTTISNTKHAVTITYSG